MRYVTLISCKKAGLLVYPCRLQLCSLNIGPCRLNHETRQLVLFLQVYCLGEKFFIFPSQYLLLDTEKVIKLLGAC